MNNLTLAVVAALLAGCVTVPQETIDTRCDMNCAVELREAQRADRTNRPDWNAHRGDEVRAINAEHRETAKLWAGEGREQRVTASGPQLALYGPVGSSSKSQMDLCHWDLAMLMTDGKITRDQRDEFGETCYLLVPEDRRDVFRAMNQSVSRQH